MTKITTVIGSIMFNLDNEKKECEKVIKRMKWLSIVYEKYQKLKQLNNTLSYVNKGCYDNHYLYSHIFGLSNSF